MHLEVSPQEERILVLAPTAADAAITQTLLDEAGLVCQICSDLHVLGQEVVRGAGAILLTEEVLTESDAKFLVQALADQPRWSDMPVLLLTSRGADSAIAVQALELLGNVTLLERPVRVTTLISGLRAALRARRRQYELRRQLERYQRQSERLRLLWEAAAVLLTTEEPHAMLRGLFAKIAPHFGLDMCINFMINQAGDALNLESYIGLKPEVARSIARVEIGQYVCGTVAASREPIAATYIQQSNEPMVGLVKSLGICAYVCNPLIAADRLLGTLSFASSTRDFYEKDELEFLQTVCHYVAYAYERLRLIRQLREEDEKKDEFLATLAHELRNPLAPIRNAALIFRMKGPIDDELQHARDIIDRQVQQMARLVDDLLDISRITRGKIALQKEQIDLAEALNDAIEASRPLIDQGAHELIVHLPPEPLYVCGDSCRLAQVFGNLLTNAAKYTDRGGKIDVTIAIEGSQAIISVKDTGIGIAPQYLPWIFDMFSQVDSALERTQGGLGIGLALVKRLVEMHDGRVEAHSAGLKQGSEFIVRLPLSQANGQRVHASPVLSDGTISEPRETDHAPRRANLRILVADDNKDAARTLTMLMSLRGHDVCTVHDGLEALERADAFRPAAMLIDIGMPRRNGYEVARAIRQTPWGREVLLVAITGWGQEDDKRLAQEAGFDYHFTKPVDLAKLEKLLDTLGKPANASAV